MNCTYCVFEHTPIVSVNVILTLSPLLACFFVWTHKWRMSSFLVHRVYIILHGLSQRWTLIMSVNLIATATCLWTGVECCIPFLCLCKGILNFWTSSEIRCSSFSWVPLSCWKTKLLYLLFLTPPLIMSCCLIDRYHIWQCQQCLFVLYFASWHRLQYTQQLSFSVSTSCSLNSAWPSLSWAC